MITCSHSRISLAMLENIVDYYRSASDVTKKKILACIFDGKIAL